MSGGFQRLSEVAQIADERSDRRAFDFSKAWVPRVEDHDDTRFLAAIPGPVLVGVIEHDDPTRLPPVNLAADFERTVLGNDER